ncbi:MAG: hypothetical protein SD837_05545 [Candidatus Electrothrix scaldis]|nr:MAG: hypothetical protein SD837_05545 [Candidatus Electrothrix sp. GW3-3]
MNTKILFFSGLILALPFVANAKGAYTDHNYSVQCETQGKTECRVQSNKAIKSVRVEFVSHRDKGQSGFIKKDFKDCPTEVSVNFNAPPAAKFFIQTCDGSSGVKVIGL